MDRASKGEEEGQRSDHKAHLLSGFSCLHSSPSTAVIHSRFPTHLLDIYHFPSRCRFQRKYSNPKDLPPTWTLLHPDHAATTSQHCKKLCVTDRVSKGCQEGQSSDHKAHLCFLVSHDCFLVLPQRCDSFMPTILIRTISIATTTTNLLLCFKKSV